MRTLMYCSWTSMTQIDIYCIDRSTPKTRPNIPQWALHHEVVYLVRARNTSVDSDLKPDTGAHSESGALVRGYEPPSARFQRQWWHRTHPEDPTCS